MFYTYMHCRASDGSPFYVGKGQRNRAYDSAHRPANWKAEVAKHGLVIKIVDTDLDEDTAFELEGFLIPWIGRERLLNQTDGGGKGAGANPSEELRSRLSKALMGRTFEASSIALMSQAMQGNQNGLGRVVTAEVRKSASEKLMGHPVSDESRRRMRETKARRKAERLAAQLEKSNG